MRHRYLIYCLIIFFVQPVPRVVAKKIHSKQFSIILPASMVALKDTSDLSQGDLYVDTVSQVVLIVSEIGSKFRSVKDYIDCSAKEIEQQLQKDYGDTTLRLISCNKSVYYPKETTALHFRVSVLPMEYDTYMMYFIHRRKKDIQFAFIYKTARQAESICYINAVMKTLRLK